MTPAPSFTVPPPVPKTARRRSLGCIIGLVLLGLFIAGVIAVAVTAYRALRLGPEARDLRDAARQHFEATGSWHPTIELRLGPVLCALGREIVIRAADDPDATSLLRAARAVDCGIYQVDAPATAAERAAFLRTATAAMTARGWTRAVAVVDETTTVAMFVPAQMGTTGEVELGALVYDDQQLIVAVVRAKVAPLMELIQRKLAERALERIER